jgi:uncharacterized protein GlcG (DUF336 family)
MTGENENLVEVFRAESEVEAISVRAILEAEGIPAAVRSFQIPAMGTIAMSFRKAWGSVMVLESDADRARDLLDEMESMEEGGE